MAEVDKFKTSSKMKQSQIRIEKRTSNIINEIELI
jgi:hypothetical protein